MIHALDISESTSMTMTREYGLMVMTLFLVGPEQSLLRVECEKA